MVMDNDRLRADLKSNKPKALVYVRVSTNEQVDGASLDVQTRTCTRYAEDELGCVVVDIYREEGESAKTANRPELQRMLKYIAGHKGEIDYIVCYQVDRVTREASSFNVGIKAVLMKYGVKLRYALNPGINETPEGKFMENVLVGVAQLENEIKAEKVHDAMAERARQGFWVTQAPLGFEVKTLMPDGTIRDSVRGERKKYPKILVPNTRNNLAQNLAGIMTQFSNGDMTEIQAYNKALELGIKGAKGAPLTFSRFDDIMRSPVYAGYNDSKRLLGGERVKLNFDGLVPLEIWERNQILLSNNKRELKPRNNELYPLDGCILCMHCGMPLHGSAPRDGSKKQIPRYYCRANIKRGHGYESAKASEIHDLFADFLQQITPTDGAIKLFKKILKRTAAKKLSNANVELDAIAKADKALSAKKKATLNLLLDGKITAEEKDFMIESLEEERESLRLRRKEFEEQQELNELTIEYVCNFIGQPAKLWQDADLESKRALQKLLFPNGLHVDLKTKKCRTEDLSPLYSVINTKKEPEGSENANMVISARVELALTG